MRDALLCCDRKQPRTIDLLFTNKKDIITNNWIEIYQHHVWSSIGECMVLVGRVLRAVSVADQKYVFMRCYNAIWCDASAKAANAMCILTYIFYFARCVLLWTEQRQPMPMDEWKLSESQSCIRNLCVRWKVTFCRSVFILRRSACVVLWEFFVLCWQAARRIVRIEWMSCGVYVRICRQLMMKFLVVHARDRSACRHGFHRTMTPQFMFIAHWRDRFWLRNQSIFVMYHECLSVARRLDQTDEDLHFL